MKNFMENLSGTGESEVNAASTTISILFIGITFISAIFFM